MTFAPLLGPGTTGVLLGPSGVGKSTLVNALIDDESRLATGEVAPDGAGRHTTTRRELVLLPSGGVIVDNPGMREVHLWIGDGDLTDAFDDIAELAARLQVQRLQARDRAGMRRPRGARVRRALRGSGGSATRRSSASWPSWPSASSGASALEPGDRPTAED